MKINHSFSKSVILYCHLSFKNYKHLFYAFRLPTNPGKMHFFSITNGKAAFLYIFFVLIGYFVFDLCSHGVYLEISWLQIMKYVVIINTVLSGFLIFGIYHRQSGLIEFWLRITLLKWFFDVLAGAPLWDEIKNSCPVLGTEFTIYFVNVILQLVGLILGCIAFKEITGTEFDPERGSSGRTHGYSRIPSGTPEQGSPAWAAGWPRFILSINIEIPVLYTVAAFWNMFSAI